MSVVTHVGVECARNLMAEPDAAGFVAEPPESLLVGFRISNGLHPTEIPSAFASSGSASAAMVLSLTASSKPIPTSCGAMRAEKNVRVVAEKE